MLGMTGRKVRDSLPKQKDMPHAWHCFKALYQGIVGSSLWETSATKKALGY